MSNTTQTTTQEQATMTYDTPFEGEALFWNLRETHEIKAVQLPNGFYTARMRWSNNLGLQMYAEYATAEEVEAIIDRIWAQEKQRLGVNIPVMTKATSELVEGKVVKTAPQPVTDDHGRTQTRWIKVFDGLETFLDDGAEVEDTSFDF